MVSLKPLRRNMRWNVAPHGKCWGRPARVVVHACPLPEAVYLDGARLEARSSAPGYAVRDETLHVRFVDDGEGHAFEIEPAP